MLASGRLRQGPRGGLLREPLGHCPGRQMLWEVLAGRRLQNLRKLFLDEKATLLKP